MNNFTPKAPAEIETFTFDFTAALGSGETINSASVTSSVVTGADPGIAAMISGAAQISAGLVLQKIQGGVAGVRYELQCTIATSAGQTLILAGDLLIQNP